MRGRRLSTTERLARLKLEYIRKATKTGRRLWNSGGASSEHSRDEAGVRAWAATQNLESYEVEALVRGWREARGEG